MEFIYWFAYYGLDSPSVRYRAQYPLQEFKRKHGIGHYLVIPGYRPRLILRFLQAYCSALFFRKRNSLIVIQRVNSGFIYATLLRLLVVLRPKDTVYDLDDADYLTHPDRSRGFFLRHCSRVAAGSEAIARHVKAVNAKVGYVPSPVYDLNIVKTSREKTFTIGWVGGFRWGHRESLFSQVFPAIRALDFPVKLVLIGLETNEEISQVRTFFRTSRQVTLDIPRDTDWNDEAALQQQISRFDVGIATLEDTPVHRAKSGIKAKQYLCAGVPVITTNLPENNRVVQPGVNGWCCTGVPEFQAALSQAYHFDEATYRQRSENARASVRHFDHLAYFAAWKQLLEGKSQPGKFPESQPKRVATGA